MSENEDAVFRATVSNIKPGEVFNRPRYQDSRPRSESLRSHESPTRRYLKLIFKDFIKHLKYFISDPPGQELSTGWLKGVRQDHPRHQMTRKAEC